MGPQEAWGLCHTAVGPTVLQAGRKNVLGRRRLDAGLLCVILFAIKQPDIPRTWNRAEAMQLAFLAIYLQARDSPETSEIIKT